MEGGRQGREGRGFVRGWVRGLDVGVLQGGFGFRQVVQACLLGFTLRVGFIIHSMVTSLIGY